jgi:hypothetical protein
MGSNCAVVTPDLFAQRILAYLGDRYLPVHSDWVETEAIAAALRAETTDVEAHLRDLVQPGLVELACPDEDNSSYAAIITTKGLLAIGRLP